MRADALASRACSIRSASARNPSDRLAREFSRAHFQGARILGANVSEICCPFPSPVEDPYFGTLEREENGTPASILIWIFTGNELKQISLSWRRWNGAHGGKKGLKRNRRLSLKDFYGKRLLNDRSVHGDWVIVKLNRTNRGICLCRRTIGV